jgi:hypothetical protein
MRTAWVTAIVIFFPAVVSLVGFLLASGAGLFCTGTTKGENVVHGLVLAAATASLVGVLYVTLLIVLDITRRDVWSWRWRYLIAGACVLEAVAVVGAIVFVALDSATFVSTGCGFFGPASNEVDHARWLYYLLGFSVAALLFQALRVARYSPPPQPPEPEPDVVGPPVD